ncbi:hypothetical protein ACIF8T_21860 [Streptomyces sp. NPDC085946]|uniref:hypothetical protein n=1 Tax=Streptomyces sp. NPDC085946 TaxID=3365744 RepID=UPI0037D8E694
MTPDLIADGLATLDTILDLAVLYVAAAAGLAALTATAIVTAGHWAFTAIAIHHHGKRLARHVEAYANHPAHRAQDREEDRP